MTDLFQKARLGRTTALNHIADGSRNIFGDERAARGRRALPAAFVSSRAKTGGQAKLV